MDLSLDESQQLLVNSFRDFFSKECPSALVRASEAAGFDAELWRRFSAMGAPGMGVPETFGGLGLGLLDLCLVGTEAGRVMAPLPFAEVAASSRLLSRYGSQASLLGQLIAGEERVSLAADAGPARDRVLVPAGGCVNHVLALRGDDLLLLSHASSRRGSSPANLGSGCPAWWDLRASRPGCVQLESGASARAAFVQAQSEWRLLLAAQLVGLAQRALAIGVDYAGQREQFGATIGSYQAISHPLADCSMRVDGAQLLVWEAAWAYRRQPGRFGLLSDMAAAFAAETAEETASTSLHTHGGYGFCEEYDIQMYYRRASAWSLAMGGSGRGLMRVASALSPEHRRAVNSGL